MANYSSFELVLSGHPFKLKEAHTNLLQSEYHRNFNISYIYSDEFTHEPPTWHLQGEGRWGVGINKLVAFLTPYELSGTITDAEPGDNFFRKVWLENGTLINCINDFMSDAHYEHCPNNAFWYEQLSYAIDEPDIYPEVITFLLKHNIITQEYLDGIAH